MWPSRFSRPMVRALLKVVTQCNDSSMNVELFSVIIYVQYAQRIYWRQLLLHLGSSINYRDSVSSSVTNCLLIICAPLLCGLWWHPIEAWRSDDEMRHVSYWVASQYYEMQCNNTQNRMHCQHSQLHWIANCWWSVAYNWCNVSYWKCLDEAWWPNNNDNRPQTTPPHWRHWALTKSSFSRSSRVCHRTTTSRPPTNVQEFKIPGHFRGKGEGGRIWARWTPLDIVHAPALGSGGGDTRSWHTLL